MNKPLLPIREIVFHGMHENETVHITAEELAEMCKNEYDTPRRERQ